MDVEEAPVQLGGGRLRCPYCGLEMGQGAWGVHKGRWCKAIAKKAPQVRKAKAKVEPEQLGGGRIRCPYCGLEMGQGAWGVHRGRYCKQTIKPIPKGGGIGKGEERSEVPIEEPSDDVSIGASSAGDEADDVCAVCAGGDSAGDNLIVFCEGKCGVAVHQRDM